MVSILGTEFHDELSNWHKAFDSLWLLKRSTKVYAMV